jgi:glutamate carboxypeptidase
LSERSEAVEAERRVIAWLGASQGDMVELLADLVNVDSGTYDKPGVDAVGEVLKRFYASQGLEIETIPNDAFGEAFRATLPHRTADDQRPIVLLGHRDTVFPKGEAQRRPFRAEGGRGYGPGVADMKAGLVMNAFVLAALARCGGYTTPVAALVTSDEEIASPACRPLIEAEARGARAILNAEPSRAPHVVVQGRKGGVFLAFEVTGKAAHSGAHYERGISAIEELACKIQALHALTDLSRGITVNVGLVAGGQTVNTVAPHARGEIDLRYMRAEDRADMIEAIRRVVETPSLPGTAGTLTIKGEFLPLEETPGSRSLLELYRGAAGDLGFEVAAEFTGGCADSGLTSAQGCPTLCSVGPVGEHGHTSDEYVELDSLVPCAQAVALAVLRLPRETGL